MTYKVLTSQEKLSITTPYMLRNDGELLTCGEIHPYIKSYRKESLEETLKYLDLHKSFLEWFYNNSLNEETKSLIKNFDRTEKTIDRLWYLTNQEFCRVRTSNYRYKIGGDNGEIYFRISSENFNWFDLIWNTCVKFIHSIDYVTIMKDPQTFGKQFDYIIIRNNKINKFPIKEFIELEGEPLVENKSLIESHWKKGVDVDSLVRDWLDNHWEELVDDEAKNYLDSYGSIEDLKEYEDLPENITNEDEAIQWIKDNVLNYEYFLNSEDWREYAEEKVCEELDNSWDSAYDYFYDCCEKVVKKINEKILIKNVELEFDISESHSISAGRWPSQYAKFTFDYDWKKVDEEIQDELDNFDCEIRFSDEHNNGQYYGEEINWLDYNNPESCNWKKTILKIISDEIYNLDDEIYEKLFGEYNLSHINLNEKLMESQVIKEPSFEHNYHYGRIWATNSSSEMISAIMNSTIALRILYDTKHKFYVYSDADDFIHRDLLEAAWEYGMYPEYTQRWQFKAGHFEDHTYQLLYAPKDKVESTYGINIKEDDYTDRIEYTFGVITGRNDYQNVFLNKIPLIKHLKKYELKHTYFGGWNEEKPIIKELVEDLKDEVSDNTLKKRRKYYLTHGLKNVFPSGLGESLDTNNIISLLSNTFGTTDEPQPTAMYVLPNGRFLFTTPLEPSDDCDYEIDEHRNIDDFLFHKGIIEDDRYLEDDGSLFTENVLNCIRFNITDEYYGNYSYIQLNQKQPTSQQYNALLKIFDYIINNRYKYISIIFDTQYGKQIRIELNNYTSDELLKKIKRFYVSGILTENKNKQLTLQDIFPYTSATESENHKDKKFYSLKESNDSWEIIKEFEENLVLIISTAGKKSIVNKKELTQASNLLQNDEKEVIIKDELFDFIDNCLKELYSIKQSNPEEVSFLKLAFSELKEAKIHVGYRYAKVEKNKIYCFRKPKGSGGALRVFFFIKNDKVVCFKAWLKGSKTEENKIIQDGVKKYLNYNK